MSEEALVPQMTLKKGVKRKVKIPTLCILMMFFCFLLIITSTFTGINLKHFYIPADIFSHSRNFPADFIHSYFYIPQIPIVLFSYACIGRKWASLTVFLYVILGLIGFPIFAMGGNISYLANYGFGYILAYIPAIFFAHSISDGNKGILGSLKAAILAVLIIHLCGITYMSIISGIRLMGFEFIKSWIYFQSGLKILYDIIFSFVALLSGKYVKGFIKYISQ